MRGRGVSDVGSRNVGGEIASKVLPRGEAGGDGKKGKGQEKGLGFSGKPVKKDIVWTGRKCRERGSLREDGRSVATPLNYPLLQ